MAEHWDTSYPSVVAHGPNVVVSRRNRCLFGRSSPTSAHERQSYQVSTQLRVAPPTDPDVRNSRIRLVKSRIRSLPAH